MKNNSEKAKNQRCLIILALAILCLIIYLFGSLADSKGDEVEASSIVTEIVSEISSEAPVDPETESKTEVETETAFTLYDVPLDADTQTAIIDICSEYDIEYELILGIISVECSSFEPKSLGDGGNSFGLMQIQPKWWSGLMAREGVTDLLDPLQNIRCGCAIINDLKSRYGTEYRALQAYNTGNPNSTNGYADRVYLRKNNLKVYPEQNIGGNV